MEPPDRDGPEPVADAALQEDIRRVLDAAWHVLTRSRFRSMKVAQVLRESGVSASWFYKRFPSKSALMHSLLDDEMRRAADRLTAHIERYSTPEEQVAGWVDAVVGIAFDEHLASRARLFSDHELARDYPVAVREANRAITASLAGVIETGVRDGRFRSPDPETDALIIYGVCGSILTDQIAGVLDLSRDTAVDRATDFVFRALGAKPYHVPPSTD